MSRWRPKFTKLEILEQFKKLKRTNPKLTSAELAEELGCNSAHVRATLARAGIALPNSRKGKPSKCGINLQKKVIRKADIATFNDEPKFSREDEFE